jgi:hypothetical protein
MLVGAHPPLEEELLLEDELELEELLLELDELLEELLVEVLLVELELLELEPPSPPTVTLTGARLPGVAVKPKDVELPGAMFAFQPADPITK